MAPILASQFSERAVQFWSFEYEFAVNALASATLVGVLCAVVGAFLVLRGMSLLGDATGHATLPGVCIAFVIVGAKETIPLLLGALIAGFVASLLVGALSRGERTRSDAAIGIVLATFFGLGIVLLSYVQQSPTAAQAGLDSFLFGNAAGVTRTQLWVLVGVAACLLAGVAVAYRALVATIFDPIFARSIGIPTSAVEYALLGALSIAVVVSIQAVGVVLVAAMLIVPPSAALFLSARLPRVLVWAALIGLVSGAVGAFVSFVFEGVATGPAMVIVAGIFFVLAFFLGPRGLLGKHLKGNLK